LRWRPAVAGAVRVRAAAKAHVAATLAKVAVALMVQLLWLRPHWPSRDGATLGRLRFSPASRPGAFGFNDVLCFRIASGRRARGA
jgi:hypothetical protein